MRVFRTRNVNEALPLGLWHLQHNGEPSDSRDGPVLVHPNPVTTVYSCPMERVLFAPARNANPFFHLFEAMWMLAGKDDARWLDTYVKNFSSRFAEDNGMMHGAYGFRWIQEFAVEKQRPRYDQLRAIARLMTENPNSRQLVLTMWNPEIDLVADVKDRPCNTHVYFRPRKVTADSWVLEMTVCCRSNDIVMGAYGANAVHMSIMQEYICALSPMDIVPGVYHQVSNNYHGYLRDVEPLLAKMDGSRWKDGHKDPYITGEAVATRLFTKEGADTLRDELLAWMDTPEEGTPSEGNRILFDGLLKPMATVHRMVRDGKLEMARGWCENILHLDWRLACQQWVDRRIDARQVRLTTGDTA